MTSEEGEPDVAAAELALGVLEGEERAAALRRLLAEPDFAAEVERWRGWLAQLFDLWPEAEPPEGLADRIDASLNGIAAPARRRFPWPLIAIASAALAACLLVVVAIRPGPTPPAPPPAPPVAAAVPPLVAAIGGEDAAVAAAFDPADGSLRLTAAPTVPAGRAAQLWVIGGDGVPYPLGLLASDATLLVLPPDVRTRLTAGATLAISVEPPGGSPTGKPTGAVIATGPLSAV